MIPPGRYDAIVVLGNGFADNWQLPDHMIKRLNLVTDLYKKGIAQTVVTCGKWSINYDRKHIVPPTTESALMAAILQRKIPPEHIIEENLSKDTLGNAYYLKTAIVKPKGYKSILVICADYQEKRAKFLFKKVFGKGYTITTISAETPYTHDPKAISSQRDLLVRQKIFLESMEDGDDSFLTDRLYSDPFYLETDAAAFFALGRKL